MVDQLCKHHWIPAASQANTDRNGSSQHPSHDVSKRDYSAKRFQIFFMFFNTVLNHGFVILSIVVNEPPSGHALRACFQSKGITLTNKDRRMPSPNYKKPEDDKGQVWSPLMAPLVTLVVAPWCTSWSPPSEPLLSADYAKKTVPWPPFFCHATTTPSLLIVIMKMIV